jgi:hypothetical protein
MAENETDPLVLADQGLADLQQLLTAATGIMGAVHQATEAAVLEVRDGLRAGRVACRD